MKIFILTEGGSKIGAGHVTRCLSLYQAFLELSYDIKIIVNGDEGIKKTLGNTNYLICDWLNNPNLIFNLIEKEDIIIIDSYLAPLQFYNKISSNLFSIYIDDYRRLDYPNGIVINGIIKSNHFNYPTDKCKINLIGNKYILLRKDFWNPPKREIKENITEIMVTFGNEDLRNLTPIIMKQLNKINSNFIKNIIVGSGFQSECIKLIEKLKDNNTNLFYSIDGKRMAEIMGSSDFAISAAGQTLNELACFGVPTFAITIIDNQIDNANSFESMGCLAGLTNYKNPNLAKNLKVTLEKFKSKGSRKGLSELLTKFIDGQGARNVAKEVLNYYNSLQKR